MPTYTIDRASAHVRLSIYLNEFERVFPFPLTYINHCLISLKTYVCLNKLNLFQDFGRGLLSPEIKPSMTVQPFTNEQLNYFKFASIVLNEFVIALRQTFKYMWDNIFGHRHGYQPWDNSTVVRNLFLAEEGGKSKVPIHTSYEEWDCTALFQATIYAKSFATPDSKGDKRKLYELYVKHHKVPLGKFHSSVVSPSGNTAETFALAIDQLRLLRNSLCHSDKSEIDKPTFDQYVQLAKEAFKALGIKEDPIDAIGGLTESDFPTKEVRRLEESLKQETRSYIECLEEVRSSVQCLEEVKSGVDKLIAQGNAMVKVEDLALLERKIDDLKLKIDHDQTGIKLFKILQDFLYIIRI